MAASATFCLEAGMRTSSCIAVLALRTRVSMSAMGSVSICTPHQLALVTPGISPAWAISRRHTRHRPNLRNTERARPQRRQRVYPRTLYFGVAFALLMSDFFAIACPLLLLLLRRGLGALTAADRAATLLDGGGLAVGTLLEGEPEGIEQRLALLVGDGRGDDGDVHAARRVDLVVLDLGEHRLVVQIERVVAPAVPAVRRQAAEVADAGDG